MNQSDHLYFRNDTGVYIWDPLAGITTHQSGLRWEDPTFSHNDHILAYTVWDQTGITHIQPDGRGGGLGLIGGPSSRAAAGFASNDILLLDETQPCTEYVPRVLLPNGYGGRLARRRVNRSACHATGWRLVAFLPGAP